MWYLHPDVRLTRRGRLFMVLDEGGTLQWSGPSFMGALEYLSGQDADSATVIGDDATYRIDFWRMPA